MFINVMPPITAEISRVELHANIELSDESLSIVIEDHESLTASINGTVRDHPVYPGPYEVFPTIEDQNLETNRCLMRGDVIVHRIPFYIHFQDVPSSVWEVSHMLHKRPSVTIVDSADNIVIGDVEYIDDDHVRITFAAAFAGKAYLN